MHLTAFGRVVLLVIIAHIQVFAIIDFNFDDDPKSDAQICCMIEHSFPQEPFPECYEQHTNSSTDNEALMCIHQCYYEAIGMFANGDQVQLDKYIKYKDGLDAEHQQSFSYALRVCGQVRLVLMKHFEANAEKPRCSPIPYFYNRCLLEVDIVNCPSDRWMNSTLCDLFVSKMKEKYGKGVQAKST
ncbi:uncharacterized protein LOC126563190 [Anopheles maculipalpis]|uniref:uncharacterized protein LOC126563190 n=1 Tax=Anopheles maculipalpis TaxID=1496333 RepID=UPI002159B274|nr:uncharacterized protein LOC126563190 [Anopheles maculipalpis]